MSITSLFKSGPSAAERLRKEQWEAEDRNRRNRKLAELRSLVRAPIDGVGLDPNRYHDQVVAVRYKDILRALDLIDLISDVS